jgi:hypothetical protein
VTETSERRTTYQCVVGHEIAAEDLDARTEILTLDHGARVRVCLEHGAPIAITERPAAVSRDSG